MGRTIETQHFVTVTRTGKGTETLAVYAPTMEDAISRTIAIIVEVHGPGPLQVAEVRAAVGGELPWNDGIFTVAESIEARSITGFAKGDGAARALATTADLFEGCNVRLATPTEAEAFCREEQLRLADEDDVEFERGFNSVRDREFY